VSTIARDVLRVYDREVMLCRKTKRGRPCTVLLMTLSGFDLGQQHGIPLLWHHATRLSSLRRLPMHQPDAPQRLPNNRILHSLGKPPSPAGPQLHSATSSPLPACLAH
jgi:hypothetical protein